ncbi:pyruvate dehydrogenase complex transcriptional repressor PdhR [Neptunicella marina]|uniref:Pyruvate dehydrogenase complex repressor n=1 Tax=Neptunicella marina TaxID=2125989 RepID=A0A8J6IRZ7_9ALTE|nr:pyruvate dehydrogenase complex transcriptional repressor PdhR [Neptunicella marina]MBC3765319.1 pyruvate dehydrogenase complex transcriptional repressor PdhR [Neptunicella marina]
MQRIKPQKLSDVIVQKLEEMLLSGSMVAGQKLPSERELAVQFDVSRPSLREAIQKLEAKGLLYRKQGGGTYVKDNADPIANQPLMALLSANPESQYDLLEFRHALEGIAAYYAALRAQKDDLDKIEFAYQLVKKSWDDNIEVQAQSLVKFYLAMAQASHNAVLLHIVSAMQPMLQDNIARNLKVLAEHSDCGDKLRVQRHKILQAIVSGDPEGARHASNEHLAFIEETLLNINRQSSQMQRTLRRIEI